MKELTSVLDLYPTLAGLAGAKLDRAWQLEGRNLWPGLDGSGDLPATTLYWKTHAGKAVRQGDWKLVVHPKQELVELFDIAADPYEKANLAEKHPAKVKELNELIDLHSSRDGQTTER